MLTSIRSSSTSTNTSTSTLKWYSSITRVGLQVQVPNTTSLGISGFNHHPPEIFKVNMTILRTTVQTKFLLASVAN